MYWASPKSERPFLERTDIVFKIAGTFIQMIAAVVQAIAVVIGAIWAYQHFGLFEAPELEHRARVKGSFEWAKLPDSAKECVGWYQITFENIGKQAVELSSLTLEAWHLDLDDVFQKQPDQREPPTVVYVDVVNKVQPTSPLIDNRELEVAPKQAPSKKAVAAGAPAKKVPVFENTYPPGVSETAGLMIVTKKEEKNKWLVFKVRGVTQVVREPEKTGLGELSRWVGNSLFGKYETEPKDWYDHQSVLGCVNFSKEAEKEIEKEKQR